MFWFQITLAFVAGIVWNKFWNTMVNAGFSIIMIKKTQLECLKMCEHVNTSVQLSLEMKYKNMPSNSAEKEQQLDDHIINALRNNMVATVAHSVPHSHRSLVKYHDWDSAMNYLKENK